MQKILSFFKNERVLSVCLNAVICVLLFLIFLQCGIYLSGSIKTDTEEAIPFDMRMLSVSAKDAVYSLDPALLQPAKAVIRVDGQAHAAIHSAAVIGDLYAEVSPVLAACFAETPLPASDAAWRAALNADGIALLCYSEALPYQVIHAFAAASFGEDNRVRQAQSILVSELCLSVCDGVARIIVRGDTGVYLFSAPGNAETADLQSYTVMYPDVFYPCVLEGDTFVTTEKISVRDISVQKDICAEITANEVHFDKWIRRFRFNPDKLNYHVEPDGTTVFVESHGVLTCTPNRIAYTAAEDGGVHISEFCSVTSEVDVYTYLRAASAWISELSAMDSRYTGGDASLRLSCVKADRHSLTLSFSLCVDNLPVYTEQSSTALTMTFTGDKLTGMTFRTAAVQRGLSRRVTFLESWSRTLLDTQRTVLAYTVDAKGTSAFAQWIARGGETE